MENSYFVKNLQCFLSLFNFNLDSNMNLYNSLIKMDNIIIKDENGNSVGYLRLDESGKVVIQALLDNYYFSSVGFSFSRFDSYGFDFDIISTIDNEKLNGRFIIKREIQKKEPLFMANLLVFKNNKFHLKYKFNTTSDAFCIVNSDNKEKLKYSNDFFVYYKDERKFQISYNNGFILYNDILYTQNSTNDINGGYYYSQGFIEDEFNKIIKEISPECFEFMEKQKTLLNKYHSNLFENLFRCVYNNSSKVKNIFDTSNKGVIKSLKKNN